MHPKKLYEANENAVKELLKLATMMNKAMESSRDLNADDEVTETSSAMNYNISSKLQNLKTARALATEITESGAKLFDFLG